MRLVEWQDGRGRHWRSWMTDDMPDMDAAAGLPAGPPDVSRLDWGLIARELHDALAARGLWTWEDVQRQGNGLEGALLAAVRPYLKKLYRENGGG